MASVEGPSPVIEGDSSMSAGEFVLKKLFAEFVALSDRKLQNIATQPFDYPLGKSLQKGEDPHFDQLLNALNEVASFCLRSILTSIFKWRDMQLQQCRSNTSWSSLSSGDLLDSPYPANRREKEYITERQELAIEFIFCLVLIEVLSKLGVHPVPESFIHTIEDYAFKHFKLQETLKESRTSFVNPNIHNMKKIADLYAEVIGVLSQSRFHSVRKKFFLEIRDPQNSSTTIISIIEGMSFIRVKMFPVDDLEQWFTFLQDCASFFLESRDKIKHAMSALLVEILLPVAAVIKFEASLPVVKKFVGMLFSHCFEQAKRVRHSAAYIPLVTVLLAISDHQFFFNHWHSFLTQVVVTNIRKADNKLQRTALESLNRLIWVYMVRFKGESNTATSNRLRYIADILFPRGQRGVHPKDMPLNIFVKLIQFIAKERLEYAMHEILDLLNMGRTRSTINPERMGIGLRAFLVITDSLEKKEGDPPLPLNSGPPPSGGPTRVKNKFLSTTISELTARKIGIAKVYPQVRRALDGILRALDHSVGKSFLSTNPSVTGRSEEEVLGPVRPKLELLKTCVAAIPRIMPEGMTREDLLEVLSRFTIHYDFHLVTTALASLQNIITNFPAWRHDVTRIFSRFILRDIPDSCPLILDSALKMLLQMISHWKTLITTEAQTENTPASPVTNSTNSSTTTDSGASEGSGEGYYCVPWVEACALVTLCSYRSITRKLSLVLLKEIRALHETLKVQTERTTVMDVIEKATPIVTKRYLATIPQKERSEARLSPQNINLTWMADRSSCFLEQGGNRDSLRDAWALCLAGLLEPHLLPEMCPTSVHIAWPYVFHRMGKAYAVLDPGGVAPEKGERPPSIKGRRPIISSPEMFLWRNYLMFVSCTAPPSTSLQASLMSSGDSAMLEVLGGRVPHTLNARNLFHKVVPLVRSEGEIREVAITALGLIHPNAFGDLVEELNSVIHDALERRGETKNLKKKKQRDALRVQITRVFALTAEHGCFRQSPMTRTDKGEVSPVFLEFIEGIKNCLEGESGAVGNELRLYFAALIANMINSLPLGEARLKLFSPEMRSNLFYLFATWCSLFGQVVLPEQELRRNPRASALSFNSLQAMSALLCCGPVFRARELEKESNIYRWLENMLSSGEPKVQTLGRKTVQMLLLSNPSQPTLFRWVVDRCYDSHVSCAQLCFHALSNTIAEMPSYPCDMVTVLHVVLFKTADLDYATRERATHLHQILDRRFFVSSEEDNDTGRRTDMLGCLTAGAYSQCHMTLSRELAIANPELTLPMFCEMVYRYEMASSCGKRSILECMVPWIQNVELIEDAHLPHPHTNYQPDYSTINDGENYPHPVLKGNGWGSIEGTKVVLHNLLYITTKYSDEYMKEVEALWSALCMWPQNIRVTLNYLCRISCVSGNFNLMLQQAKRIMVCLSRHQVRPIVIELIKDLQSVEHISADIQGTDSPPYYHVTTAHGTVPHTRAQPEGLEGTGWAISWRVAVRARGSQPLPLPLPFNLQYFVNMKDLLKAPQKPYAMHRCSFALILLSELVAELCSVDWSPHLPLLLHMVILGLDLHRPLVFEHSKKLLGNLLVVLACKNDKVAALQARFVQQEVALQSFSATSLSSDFDLYSGGSRTHLELGSVNSLHLTNSQLQSALSVEAQELIQFVASRDTHRPPWPFADLASNRHNPSGQVAELSSLVTKILQVFQHVAAQSLKEKWTMIALQWATSCSSHQYASQSFQVCRALQLPLSSSMFREVLTRLAESSSEDKEDMQSYVLEIVLTIESAVDHIEETQLQPSNIVSPRKVSEIAPLPGDQPDAPHSFSPVPPVDTGAGASTGSMPAVGVVKRHHSRGRSVSNKAEMMSGRPNSAKAKMEVSTSHDGGGALPRALSPPPPIGPTIRETPHSPLATASMHLREHEVGVALPTRPHSTIIQPSRTAPIAIPESANSTIPIIAHQTPTNSPQKSSPSESVLQENQLTSLDGGAAPANSASAPETKTAKDPIKDTLPSPITSTPDEKDGRSRKSSEPPPSLQALFDHDMGSSRRWMNKQISADQVHIAHPKQHSLDSTHLRSVTPVSPKLHSRRVKSPSSDKNSRLDISEGVVLSGIQRAPSHPHLNSPLSTPHVAKQHTVDTPIKRAHSTQQLQDIEKEEDAGSTKNRADSPQVESSLLKSNKDREIFQSKESLREPTLLKTSSLTMSHESLVSNESVTLKEIAKESVIERTGPARSQEVSAESSTENLQAPQQVISRQHSELKRRNSTLQQLLRRESDGAEHSGKKRPRSMIETSSYRYGPSFSSDTIKPTPDLQAQLFWTATSLLESDFEGEYLMAQRLFSRVLDHLELSMNDTYERLEALLQKMKWTNFPGVQQLLLKGLTLESTSVPSRELLSRITLHSTRSVFDPSQYDGLPLNVMSLMPILIHHFEQPSEFCIKVVSNIQQACTSVDLTSEESKTKLVHMSKMFQMYATKDFTNGVDLWLAGICRYLNDAYPPLAVKMLRLLAELLDKGSALYHRPVLRLLYEYTRLQDPNSHEMKKMAGTIMTVATQHVKGQLWKEALDLLKLAVSNSASLVQPPTRGLPVDLGLFNQTLPGPTLQFKMDLQHGSYDLGLAVDSHLTTSSWKRPQFCQRRTRERLLSVLNASGPVPVIMSSPSVIFTDEQALVGDKGTLYSGTSDEAASSITDDIYDSSQPESSQTYINAVGNEFDFLNDFEYKYDHSSNDSETPPGPFTRPSEPLDTELEEREEDSSLPGSLTGSRLSLTEGEETEVQAESDDHDLEESTSPPRTSSPKLLVMNLSRSPDNFRRKQAQSPLSIRKQHHRSSFNPPSDIPELESHDQSADQEQSREASPAVRQESQDKSLDSNESSPPSKRWSDDPHRQLGSQSEQRQPPDGGNESQIQPPDVGSERPIQPPDANEREVSEPPSEETSPQKPPSEHSKTESADSRHSEPLEDRPTQEEPPDTEPVVSTPPESVISPTLKVAAKPLIEEECVDRLQGLSEDSLGDAVLDMLEEKDLLDKSHDTSGDQTDPLQDEQTVQHELKPEDVTPEEDLSIPASDEREIAPHTEDAVADTTITEQPVEEEEQNEDDGLGILAELDEVLDKEDQESSEEEEEEDVGTEPKVEREGVAEQKEADGDGAAVSAPVGEDEVTSSEQDEDASNTDEERSHDLPEPSQSLDPSEQPKSHDPPEQLRSHDSLELPRSHDPPEQSSTHDPPEQPTSLEQPEELRSHDHPDPQGSHDPPEQLRSHDLPPEVQKSHDRPEQPADQATESEPYISWDKNAPSDLGASKFISCSADEIEEVWHDHVITLACDKSPSTAVKTYFLFDRLLSTLRLQFSNLTREACNYLGNGFNSIASHFLVTTEFLLSEFEIPKIYIDAEMILQSGLLERLVFTVLELEDNLSTYTDKRKNVQDALALFKQTLRQTTSISQDQAALSLCRSVHKFHFQLLVLLGSYVKLTDMLQPPLEKSSVADICAELTTLIHECEDAMLTISRGPSPPFDDHSEKEVRQLVGVADAVQLLEDILSQKQYLKAVQLLHTIRKHWREDVFGSGEEDDVHCLFFIYARYITDQQEGVLCMTNTEQKLSEVHSKLMSQNISLHSLLAQPGEQATPPRESHDSASSKQATPPPVHVHTRGASRTLPGGFVEHSV